MFFRREKPRQYTFDERLKMLRDAGFNVQNEPGSGARAMKLGCAAVLKDGGMDHPEIGKAGIVVGNETAHMVHGGYQMFFKTPSGKTVPALAEYLKSLHTFEEDLKEALGLTSLYNQSLGTRADEHLYDRVKDRDTGGKRRPWEAPVPDGAVPAK
jgi:hypothetical protein